jgi:hypothetical protein
VAWQQFFLRVCGLRLSDDLMRAADGCMDTALSTCYWWPHRSFVVACERPQRLSLETPDPSQPFVRRLHHETDAAALWPDGWGIYAWHGVRVPAQVILAPETLTVAQIQAEENAEVRRVMIERMGWDKWLADTGATPVQYDRFGSLYRTEMDGASLGVVVVTNSTPEPDGHYKRYALLVPAEHETAHAAVASTFGLTAEQYRPALES